MACNCSFSVAICDGLDHGVTGEGNVGGGKLIMLKLRQGTLPFDDTPIAAKDIKIKIHERANSIIIIVSSIVGEI